MARRLNLLSPKFIETVDRPGRYSDGGGLYLQVAAAMGGGVTKSWLFRFMRGHVSRRGKPISREMGLGALSTHKRDGLITTKEARERAYRAREDLKAGIDPIEARKGLRAARRLEEARGVTFAQCAAEYIESHKAGWKGEKHVKLWRGSLKRYVEPVMGNVPVVMIDTALVLKALKPIWEMKTKTAVDVRLRIELILNWAKTHGYRDGENPARWKGHIKNALPDPAKVVKVKHLPAMPYEDVPALMLKLRQETTTAAAALEWTVLTVVRSDNTFAATWSEVDREKKVWTIPASRMKADADLRVPLTDRAIEILNGLAQRSLTDEIASEPIQLAKFGLDRLSPRFCITLTSPFFVPGLRGCAIFCLGHAERIGASRAMGQPLGIACRVRSAATDWSIRQSAW
ncbi:DUF4102 domain-containing protein [Bradyrhizobium rifense]|uniref:DUF4102 domain-containing protein n=1 Tax=Bradyrhizobium rifense TaxID=515499 RepID=A0A5D3KAG1_9BRAD|nr:integrase arm-type DNA-binding domain-containing protein [Bradyrhizobium rifense]TYL91323.1 DUF4102 domain-containing protein [Bradyrhizobium rifense]